MPPHSPGLGLEEPSPGNSRPAAPAARPRPWPSQASAGLLLPAPPSRLPCPSSPPVSKLDGFRHCAGCSSHFSSHSLVSCPVPASLSCLILRDVVCTWRSAWIPQPCAPQPHVRGPGVGRGGPCSRGPRVCSLRASANGNLSNQGEWPCRSTQNRLCWIPELGRAACVIRGRGAACSLPKSGTSKRKWRWN